MVIVFDHACINLDKCLNHVNPLHAFEIESYWKQQRLYFCIYLMILTWCWRVKSYLYYGISYMITRNPFIEMLNNVLALLSSVIDLFPHYPESHNVPVPCPTLHHFVAEMCTCAHFCYKIVDCGIYVWCIVGIVGYMLPLQHQAIAWTNIDLLVRTITQVNWILTKIPDHNSQPDILPDFLLVSFTNFNGKVLLSVVPIHYLLQPNNSMPLSTHYHWMIVLH